MKFGAGKGSAAKPAATPKAITRHSSGFEQFCAMLQSSQNLSILDMAGISQSNISFITSLGHRISSDDIIGTMQDCFGSDFLENELAASNAQRFLDQTLTFPDQSFDGALVWDALQFVTSPLLERTVEQLLRVMRPGGLMLVFFSSDDKATRVPVYNYRIQDPKTLVESPRDISYQRGQYFNNRAIEKIFDKASSLKFFLTRDHQREVLVRR